MYASRIFPQRLEYDSSSNVHKTFRIILQKSPKGDFCIVFFQEKRIVEIDLNKGVENGCYEKMSGSALDFEFRPKGAEGWVKSNIGQNLQNGNPNPYRFTILKHTEIDAYVILKVHYPDCNNYEGTKILVFRSVPLLTLLKKRLLDPHFSKHKHAPIARFVPTNEGWEMARKFCNVL